MSFVYTLIANNTTLLCDYTKDGGNFERVAQLVLRKVTEGQKQARCTFIYDQHRFHYLLGQHQDLIFMCMTDDDVHTTLAFQFLNEIATKFKYNPQKGKAVAYAMKGFRPVLQKIMEKYNSGAATENVNRYDIVNGQMNSVKNVMIDNVNNLLERGEKLDILVHKTQMLQQEAFTYSDTTKKLKCNMYCQSMRCTIYAAIALVFALYFMTAHACGYDFGKCIQTSQENNSK